MGAPGNGVHTARRHHDYRRWVVWNSKYSSARLSALDAVYPVVRVTGESNRGRNRGAGVNPDTRQRTS